MYRTGELAYLEGRLAYLEGRLAYLEGRLDVGGVAGSRLLGFAHCAESMPIRPAYSARFVMPSLAEAR